MKLRPGHSPLLIFLLPSLAIALTSNAVVDTQDIPGVGGTLRKETFDASAPVDLKASRRWFPTKDAPVDGKDGKPHLGPFVGTDGPSDNDRQGLPPLKGRPDDPTMFDGKKIPETNDGVMFDKNREHPQEGTTGLEGGVSEKDKARKAQEGLTGSKAVTQPESPKAQPPLPHSEEEKIRSEKAKLGYGDDGDADYIGGLDKSALPDKSTEKSLPVSDTTIKDPLDVYKSKTGSPNTVPATGSDDDEEGIIQPFHSFILSLAMILVSEVGDKTFLVAALMAMKHDRIVVFSAAYGALVVMTILSAFLGQVVPTLLPKWLVSLAAAILFFVFGGRLLQEGMKMDPNEGVTAEMHEVEQELAEKEKELGRRNSTSPYALEMGLNGRSSRAKGRFASPPRSPSQSPTRSPTRGDGLLSGFIQGTSNLFSLLLSPAWVQTFIMTFLGEWGDRSQIATIAMATGQDYWWVILGALVGHAVCTGAAVLGGRAIAGRVSLKVVTIGGAVAFLLFGFIYLVESFYT